MIKEQLEELKKLSNTENHFYDKFNEAREKRCEFNRNLDSLLLRISRVIYAINGEIPRHETSWYGIDILTLLITFENDLLCIPYLYNSKRKEIIIKQQILELPDDEWNEYLKTVYNESKLKHRQDKTIEYAFMSVGMILNNDFNSCFKCKGVKHSYAVNFRRIFRKGFIYKKMYCTFFHEKVTSPCETCKDVFQARWL